MNHIFLDNFERYFEKLVIKGGNLDLGFDPIGGNGFGAFNRKT